MTPKTALAGIAAVESRIPLQPPIAGEEDHQVSKNNKLPLCTFPERDRIVVMSRGELADGTEDAQGPPVREDTESG
eukprot:4128787-Heterocapsa_arctica.AAC.1